MLDLGASGPRQRRALRSFLVGWGGQMAGPRIGRRWVRLAVPALGAAILAWSVEWRPGFAAAPAADDVTPAVANDNRTPAGTVRGGVRIVRLEARLAAWRPDVDVDSAVTVQAFAEAGGSPRIPGPLVRATQGAELRVSVRNLIPDSTLVVHGLRAGTASGDTVRIPPGAEREVRFRAGEPGTYLYWGTTTGATLSGRGGRDAQLTGAIVIDPAGTRPDAAERIFVTTLLDILPDTTRPPPREDLWDLAINGLSWPHTERLRYGVGDTVRWRWLNGTYLSHPMHLHGFHFRVTAKGDGRADTSYATELTRLAVTELMEPGSTFSMEWVPARAGNWLMHCHMLPHVVPFPARPDSARVHDVHDVARHPLTAMSGLVLGVTVVERPGGASPPPAAVPALPRRHLRMLAQQAPAESGKPAARGYVVQRGAAPRTDSVEVPGPPLVLTRGETTAITVVNRLPQPTTVHWHGMELESVFDGVSGWSGLGASLAPLLAPGDSFTVTLTPPRAGTYIYHTHMDEEEQLVSGMYGPLIVLEPGERHDRATDLTFMVGQAVVGGTRARALNGQHQPAPITLRAGTTYRLRLINVLPAAPVGIGLVADSVPLAWRAVAKDGASLPAVRRVTTTVQVKIGVGETYDFEWTPAAPVDASLDVHFPDGRVRLLRQALRVR